MGILVKGARIITQNAKREILEGDVLVEGNEIVEVGKVKGRVEFEISGKGKLLLPGLVNTHNHVGMTLLRGYADDMPLHDWLTKAIWPREAKLKKEDVYAGSLLGCAEMIRSGTTSFADMYFFMDETAKAVEESGMCALLSHGMIDLENEEKREKELKEAERIVRKFSGKANGRICGSFGPHAPYSCSRELLQKANELSEKYNVPLQIHLSETRKEVFDLKKKTGKRPADYLDELGLLSERALLAHCVWLTKQECALLGKRKASVSHCPVSNAKLATGGVSPIPELTEAKANVSLGTDGACSNNSLDMFETMKYASLMQKAHRWSPEVLPAQEVLDFATRNGASALGINAGSIEKGKLADFILIDLKAPNLTPLHSPISHLVYAARGANVSEVVIDGKIVMRERVIQTFDEEKALKRAQKSAEELCSR
ncbi:MAG: amidohydrolase [Candidatus Micrarchaeota archaeon]